MPPVKEVKKEELVIDNSDDFYSGLPKLYKKRDLKSRSKAEGVSHLEFGEIYLEDEGVEGKT